MQCKETKAEAKKREEGYLRNVLIQHGMIYEWIMYSRGKMTLYEIAASLREKRKKQQEFAEKEIDMIYKAAQELINL